MAVPSFEDWLGRLRAGDNQAAAELVRIYEPGIRRVVRYGLRDARLKRVIDTRDVCQAVFVSFFSHLENGDFRLTDPDQLGHLLRTIARNRLRDAARHEHRACRDNRRQLAGNEAALRALPGHTPSPARVLADRELIEQVRGRLKGEERWLVDQRILGRGWHEIGDELGAKPDAVRKRLARAARRVLGELHLPGDSVYS